MHFLFSSTARSARIISIIVVFLGPICISIAAADDSDVMRAAAQRYLDNRTSFSNITCNYRIRSGRCASVEEALRAGPTDDVVEAKCRWIVRDRCFCQTIESDPPKGKPVQLPDGSFIHVGALPCDRRLCDGTFQLSYDVLANRGQIAMRIDLMGGRPGSWDQTPFDMGIMGEAESTSPAVKILEGKSEHLLLIPTTDSSIVQVEAFGDEEGHADYLFDSKQGYLPVEIWNTDSKGLRTMRMVITAAKECSTGRWFPMRSVIMRFAEDKSLLDKSSPDKGSPEPILVDVRETIVDSLNVDTRPADSELVVKVEKDAVLNEFGIHGTPYKLGEAMNVGLGDLVKLRQLCGEALGESQRDPATMKSPSTSINLPLWFTIAIFLIVLVAGGAMWFIRCRVGR